MFKKTMNCNYHVLNVGKTSGPIIASGDGSCYLFLISFSAERFP